MATITHNLESLYKISEGILQDPVYKKSISSPLFADMLSQRTKLWDTGIYNTKEHFYLTGYEGARSHIHAGMTSTPVTGQTPKAYSAGIAKLSYKITHNDFMELTDAGQFRGEVTNSLLDLSAKIGRMMTGFGENVTTAYQNTLSTTEWVTGEGALGLQCRGDTFKTLATGTRYGVDIAANPEMQNFIWNSNTESGTDITAANIYTQLCEAVTAHLSSQPGLKPADLTMYVGTKYGRYLELEQYNRAVNNNIEKKGGFSISTGVADILGIKVVTDHTLPNKLAYVVPLKNVMCYNGFDLKNPSTILSSSNIKVVADPTPFQLRVKDENGKTIERQVTPKGLMMEVPRVGGTNFNVNYEYFTGLQILIENPYEFMVITSNN
jgi:hypothetical protein